MTDHELKKRVAIAALIVLGVFAVLFTLAVIGRNKAMHAGYEAAALQNLKTIATVEVQYFNTHKRTFGTLAQLCADSGLSTKFNGNPAIVDGYVFKLMPPPQPAGASWYEITADPQDNSTGKNHFYLDSDDAGIRVNADRQAGPADPFQ
jgi:hypothetical protein